MSYVSIWKSVSDRIIEAALHSEKEIIGLLLGKLEKDTIIIEDSITGEYSAETNRVILPPQTLAKIADDLVKGKLKGNVVGWYHSHVDSGLFFSATDIQTQKNLQQFSPLIVAMVVDASTGAVGYYRVDPQTAKANRILDEKLSVYREPSDAVPPRALAEAPVRRVPVIKTQRTQLQLKLPRRSLTLMAVVVALAATALVIGVALYRNMTATPLSISHTPIFTATIGTPIEVRTNVTGSPSIVRLLYAVGDSGSSIVVGMSPRGSGQYAYTIPGDQVTGIISYYIEAVDASGNRVSSNRYQIQIADFRIIAASTVFILYRTKTATGTLSLLPLNGFNGTITLAAKGQPPGLSVNFDQNPIPAGVTSINMNLISNQQAANGSFDFTVTATYLAPNAIPVTRQTAIMVTVTDFDLQATPIINQLTAGGVATYQLVVTIRQGFADRINVSVQGLPPEAVATLSNSGPSLGLGPGTTTITLQISTSTNIKPGSYTLTIIASGGGIVHSGMVQLTVG